MQHVRREDRTGVRLPANHDEIAGEVAKQDAALDLCVLCGTGRVEKRLRAEGEYGSVLTHARTTLLRK